MRLEQEGYLARELDRRHFRAGPQAEYLAFNIVRRGVVTTERHAILEALVQEIGETCNFTAPAGRDVLYVDRVEAGWPLRMTLEPGSRVPIHCTASGKLFLATMDAPRRRRILDSLSLKALTPRTITTRKGLDAELARIAARGYSTDDEEFIIGLIAVAVPVIGATARVLGAVACHAPKARLSLARAIEHLPRMEAAAATLAKTFK
jgi:DNA-binding IclR family transcriptional regulator